MSWLRPWAWWVLLALVPIVLLHLKFGRRQAVSVSSLILWQNLGSPGIGRRGMRSVRDRLALLLIAAALLMFTVALAGPITGEVADAPERLVVVLDTSASMNAVVPSTGRSRFESARAVALEALDRLGPLDEVAVWAASDEPRVLVEPTRDVGAAEASLRLAEPTLRARGLDETLRLCDLARSRPGLPPSRVLVVTDAAGAAQLAPRAAESDELLVAAVGPWIGENARIDLDVVGGLEEFLRVRLTTTDGPPVPRRVVISREGRQLQEFVLTPGEDGSAEAKKGVAAGDLGGRLEARLEPPDEFPEDDRSSLLLPSRTPLLVTVVAAGASPSPFLVEALRAMPALVDPNRARLARTDAPAAALDAADVVVVDGSAPSFLGPSKNHVWFRDHDGRTVQDPVIWSTSAHPVVAGVDLSSVRLDRAVVLELGPDDEALIESAEGPVALAGRARGARYVVFGFRPDASTLPLEPAFPLLVRNALRWMGDQPLLPARVVAGRPLPLHSGLPVDAARLRLLGPGERELTRLEVDGGKFITPVPLPPPGGPYVARLQGLDRPEDTIVAWEPPDGFHIAPRTLPDDGLPGASAALAALPDRAGNVDTRQRHAPLAAGLGAAALLLGAVLLGVKRRQRAPKPVELRPLPKRELSLRATLSDMTLPPRA